MKFDNGEEEFYLSVISSPIDAGSDATPALKTTSDVKSNWWKILLGVIALVVIIVLILKFAPWLIYGIGKVIAMPFKGLASLCRSGKERRRERNERRQEKKKDKKERKEAERFDKEWEERLIDEIDWDDPFWSELDDFNG